jgi:hypothetical protein
MAIIRGSDDFHVEVFRGAQEIIVTVTGGGQQQ